ncbi:MAG: CrcB family protein [Nitriliruptor sp.]
MSAAGLVWVTIGLAVAGAVGSLVRHEVVSRAGPSGTASRARAVAGVNLAGAAIVAVAGLTDPGPGWRTIVVVGLAGSLTTFSTWVVDAVTAHGAGRGLVRVAAWDLLGQLVVGVAVVAIVLRLG